MYHGSMSTGYSPNPLPRKLGFTNSLSACLLHAPDEYLKELNILQSKHDSKLIEGSTYGFIHGFYTSRSELQATADALVGHLAEKGILWISWPKKSQKVITSDITEQDLRDTFLPLGVVDIKVCAVSDVWSGLKFVWRKQ